MADTRDICQNVQGPDILSGLCTIRFARNIKGDKFSPNAFCHGASVGFIAVGNPNIGPGLAKNFRNRCTNARSRAGDKYGFILETKLGKSFLYWLETI